MNFCIWLLNRFFWNFLICYNSRNNCQVLVKISLLSYAPPSRMNLKSSIEKASKLVKASQSLFHRSWHFPSSPKKLPSSPKKLPSSPKKLPLSPKNLPHPNINLNAIVNFFSLFFCQNLLISCNYLTLTVTFKCNWNPQRSIFIWRRMRDGIKRTRLQLIMQSVERNKLKISLKTRKDRWRERERERERNFLKSAFRLVPGFKSDRKHDTWLRNKIFSFMTFFSFFFGWNFSPEKSGKNLKIEFTDMDLYVCVLNRIAWISENVFMLNKSLGMKWVGADWDVRTLKLLAIWINQRQV